MTSSLLGFDQFHNNLYPHPCVYCVQDSLSLLGDIVGSCMRPSAPDGDVWKAMADKMAQLKRETLEN